MEDKPADMEIRGGPISKIRIPEHLRGDCRPGSEKDMMIFEDQVVEALEPHIRLLSRYKDYLRKRMLMFRATRHVLKDLFHCGVPEPFPRALEVGCGFGFQSLLLSRFCGQLTALDIPAAYGTFVRVGYRTSVEMARDLLGGAFSMSSVECREAWAHETGLPENSLDLVYSEQVLEHIPNLDEALQEWKRILRPGGLMIAGFPPVSWVLTQWAKANMGLGPRRIAYMIAVAAAKWLGKVPNRYVLELNGTIVPPCHSEHLRDYEQQIELCAAIPGKVLSQGFVMRGLFSRLAEPDLLVAEKP